MTFEEKDLGVIHGVGDTLVSDDVPVEFVEFHSSVGTWVVDGSAFVEVDYSIDPELQFLQFYRINADFIIPELPDGLNVGFYHTLGTHQE